MYSEIVTIACHAMLTFGALSSTCMYLLCLRSYDRVVWLVISDSMAVKEIMSEEYGGKVIKAPTKTLKREIIHTTAKGMHTRPKRGPNTIDFAAAFLNFYLIGESDIVINTGGIYSFGVMASLRTARPLFTVQNAQDPECKGSACYCKKAFDAGDAFKFTKK